MPAKKTPIKVVVNWIGRHPSSEVTGIVTSDDVFVFEIGHLPLVTPVYMKPLWNPSQGAAFRFPSAHLNSLSLNLAANSVTILAIFVLRLLPSGIPARFTRFWRRWSQVSSFSAGDVFLLRDVHCIRHFKQNCLLNYPPGNSNIPPGEKEKHLQKCLGKGYISSQQASISTFFYIYMVCQPSKTFQPMSIPFVKETVWPESCLGY